jgi:hypothetical protein
MTWCNRCQTDPCAGLGCSREACPPQWAPPRSPVTLPLRRPPVPLLRRVLRAMQKHFLSARFK